MADDNDTLQESHDKGQTDASNDKHDPPHQINPGDGFLYGDKNVEKWEKENKEYDQGWSHTHDQKK